MFLHEGSRALFGYVCARIFAKWWVECINEQAACDFLLCVQIKDLLDKFGTVSRADEDKASSEGSSGQRPFHPKGAAAALKKGSQDSAVSFLSS